jgi:hypothetical protein
MKTNLILLVLAFFISIDSQAFTRRVKTMDMEDDGSGFTYSGSYGGDCTNVPSKVVAAFKTAQKFSQTCWAAKLSPGKKIVVNDYSMQGHEQMYIFDQAGNCIDSTYVSYGSGNKNRGAKDRLSTSCASNGSYKTPAGMHMTGPHGAGGGGDYNSSNSLKLAGLSGQGNCRPLFLMDVQAFPQIASKK